MISFSLELDTARSIDPKAPDAGDSFVRALAGDWHGRGFSLGVWPSRQAAQPCFLEMHRTSESLFVAPVGDASDGDGAPEPSTLVFDQNVSDTISGVPLVREAGMWFAHPASSLEREAGQTLTLISTGSNGEVTIASGDIARSAFAEPAIPPINTAPFAVDAPVPEAGTRGGFAPYDLGDVSEDASRCRTALGAARPSAFEGLTPQAVLDDPTSLLRAVVERQVVERLMTAHVADSTALDLLAPTGPAPCATEATVRTSLWIERIRDGASAFDQLQYVQKAHLHFAPFGAGPTFVWPQVRVATLRRVAACRQVEVH